MGDEASHFGPLQDVRIQQRNGRKTLTTVQGLPAVLDQKRILKAFKKVGVAVLVLGKLRGRV